MPRSTALLRNAAKAAGEATKASGSAAAKPMSADHTLYHSEPTGFWKKFRDAVVVNPEISSGLPIPLKNRYPPPGSRTERYATPATKASDPAFNPYHKRDFRRNYPQTSTITQPHLASLLLSSPSLSSLPPPSTAEAVRSDSHGLAPAEQNPGQNTQAVVTSSVPSLSSILEKLPEGKAFSGSGINTASGSSTLPPSPPASKIGGRWVPQKGDEIPHDSAAYFPMIGYK